MSAMRRTLLTLTTLTGLALGGLLLGAAPPGVPPAPEALPGCDPCLSCSISLTEGGLHSSLISDDCFVTMSDLQLEIEDGNASASYDLSVTHGLESLADGESAELDFDDPGFTPTSAKLNYTLDDGSYGTSSLAIK